MDFQWLFLVRLVINNRSYVQRRKGEYQNREPCEPLRGHEVFNEERSRHAPDRENPWQNRLDGWLQQSSSSSSSLQSLSLRFHSMDGKAMLSSTCLEASSNSDMSNDDDDDDDSSKFLRDRFRADALIMGFPFDATCLV